MITPYESYMINVLTQAFWAHTWRPTCGRYDTKLKFIVSSFQLQPMFEYMRPIIQLTVFYPVILQANSSEQPEQMFTKPETIF